VLLKPQLRCVFFANCCHKTELYETTDYSGRKVRAVRVVTEIFGKFFFMAVWSPEARLDLYPGHGKNRVDAFHYLIDWDALRNDTSVRSYLN